MARNRRGQITGVKPVEISITKRLLAIASEQDVKLKVMVRDELENTLRHEVYASYKPATKRGQEVQDYNETHKHQKAKPYHHTGTLIRNIHAVIDEYGAKAVITDEEYDNGSSTVEVYDYLKFGTTDTPKKASFDYAGGTKFSKYISQDPHNFEARTRDHMKLFLDKVEREIEQNGTKNINPKYLKKLRKSDM